MKFFNHFLIITIFFLNSCASNFYQVPVAQGNIVSKSMLSKIEEGLTKAQVRYIMGTPSINDPFNKNRWDYIGFEIIGETKRATVHHVMFFEENKLVEWKTVTKNEENENFEERSIIESTKKSEK